MGLSFEREGSMPRERDCPNPGADCECDVRRTGRDGLLAVEAEGDRASRLAARGCDTDVDDVFDRHALGGGGQSADMVFTVKPTQVRVWEYTPAYGSLEGGIPHLWGER